MAESFLGIYEEALLESKEYDWRGDDALAHRAGALTSI